ncbi:hypothetical protein BT63DRAFT_459574 [Microthyrium microscopicum]|uniref:F-box domain-containing protein n=1 Tax=Microthyrium microscopicum TaxID=703497 RepID=A0A6A6U0J5_9PEZI|nr:hypothetical protein BT63DRAFT_459574 [Microthyrium microscopicum]
MSFIIRSLLLQPRLEEEPESPDLDISGPLPLLLVRQKRPPILALPNELLSMIIEYATQQKQKNIINCSDCPSDRYYPGAKVTALVCRRFRPISQRLSHRHMRIDYYPLHNDQRLGNEHLVKKMLSTADIWAYCHNLHIAIHPRVYEWETNVIAHPSNISTGLEDLDQLLAKVKCLMVEWKPDSAGYLGYAFLKEIMDRTPNVLHLTTQRFPVDGLYGGHDHCSTLLSGLQQLKHVDMRGSRFVHGMCWLERMFVNQQDSITHFASSVVRPAEYQRTTTIEQLALQPHGFNNLQKIVIELLGNNLVENDAAKLALLLIGPKTHTVVIDLKFFSLFAFTPGLVDWIQQFGATAHQYRPQLRSIFIHYEPIAPVAMRPPGWQGMLHRMNLASRDFPPGFQLRHYRYPWDVLDEMRTTFKDDLDIELVYSERPLSTREFELLRGRRAPRTRRLDSMLAWEQGQDDQVYDFGTGSLWCYLFHVVALCYLVSIVWKLVAGYW